MEESEFWAFLEEWENRQSAKHRTKVLQRLSHPELLLESMLSSVISRIVYSFENEKFGVISAFHCKNTKKQNLENQYSLVQKIQRLGLRYEAHIGFWDGISHRGIFVPKIEQRMLKSLAGKYKQHAYILGERGDWKCFQTKNSRVLTTGSDLRVMDADKEFLLYYKIRIRITELSQLLIQAGSEQAKYVPPGRTIIQSIKRQISDFERILDEIIYAK